jgi:bifunctional non-homologous end joining protein LigD
MKDAHPFDIGDVSTLFERSRDKALRGWGFAAQALPDL